MSSEKGNNKNTDKNKKNKNRTIFSQTNYFKNGNGEPKIYSKNYDSANPNNSDPDVKIPDINIPNFHPNINFPMGSFYPPEYNQNIPMENFWSGSNTYPDWMANQMAWVDEQTKNIKKKSDKEEKKTISDPSLYLNKALYYYYNQYPNFNPFLKPCASPFFAKYNFPNQSYYDKCPDYYYDICQKINKQCPGNINVKKQNKANTPTQNKPQNWECEKSV